MCVLLTYDSFTRVQFKVTFVVSIKSDHRVEDAGMSSAEIFPGMEELVEAAVTVAKEEKVHPTGRGAKERKSSVWTFRSFCLYCLKGLDSVVTT